MDIDSTETFVEEKLVLHRVKFVLFLTLQVSSIVIYLSIFVYFTKHRALFQIHLNQALSVLLVVNFIQLLFDLPMVINFYRLGYISPATAGYCTWWTFFEYTMTGANLYLMATICIQRHLLIFHSHLLHHRLKCFALHQFPLALSIVYPIIFYLIAIIFYPCDGTQWDFYSNICGLGNCYLLFNKLLATYDWVVNVGSPIIVIIIANFALVIRVMRQRYRRHRVVSWRKQRRMTLQLLGISSLYFFTWIPNIFIAFVQQTFLPGFLSQVQLDYIYDLTYLICVLLPWTYLGLYPEYVRWLRKLIFRGDRRGNNSVRPHTLTLQ
jgi:hypothetical protein